MSELESAMGRPASWAAAMPAVVVGGIALLLGGYGYWLLPKRLPQHYTSQLVESRAQYDSLSQSDTEVALGKLLATAGEVDVVYARLVALKGGEPQLYWQWAMFEHEHAATLRAKIEDPAASLTEVLRKRLTDQMTLFDGKARNTVTQLAAGESQFSGRAQLWAANQRYRQAVERFVVPVGSELVEQLRGLVDEKQFLDDDELEAAKLLAVQFAIECAWQGDVVGQLVLDQSRLEQADELFKTYRPVSSSSSLESTAMFRDRTAERSATLGLEWTAIEGLLGAFGDQQEANAKPVPKATDSNVHTGQVSGERVPWKTRLSEVQMAALQGDWEDAAFQLEWNNTVNNVAVRAGFARTVCRLAYSPLASRDDDWTGRIDVGLQLAWRAAPHLPELAQICWMCATSKLEASEVSAAGILSPKIPAAIAAGGSGVLKHSVSALASALAGQSDVAGVHVQLIRRSGESLSIVARTSLWALQTPEGVHPSQLNGLTGLLEAAVKFEAEAGLNWFVLGVALQRTGRMQDAAKALERARELLGDVAAIQDLLAAVQKKVRE